MNESILSAIDAEIARLQQARDLLSSIASSGSVAEVVKRGPGRPKGTGAKTAAQASAPKKRVMSDEARARIAAAQKKRWAAVKKT